MAAYRRVYGFSHLWADCRGLGSAPEPTLVLSTGLPLPCKKLDVGADDLAGALHDL